MRLILILLSCGILVSCGNVRQRTRQSRGVLHGVDLRQILAAVEPGFNLYSQAGPLPYIQQFALPFQPSQQPYFLNLPPILTQQLALPSPAVTGSAIEYNAPRPLPQPQQYNVPELREELSSVAVAAAGAGAQSNRQQQLAAPQQQYGPPPANVQPPQREYGTPQREYGTPQREYGTPQREYGTPAATSQENPSNQYGAPAPTSQNPSNQYGAPQATSQRDQLEISQPVPAQSYGVPNPAALLSNAAPAQSYGAPASNPSLEYGAPSGSASAFSSAFGGLDGVDISRDVSIHVPAPESYDQQPRFQPKVRTPKKPKKNYKIIFIKAPTPPPPPVPEIPEIEPEPEQKTLVYVLVQKPEPVAPIVIPTPAPAPKSKPEVYFVKYRQAVREEGFAESSSAAHENLDRGTPLGYDDSKGYNAPSQQFDLPRNEPKTGY